MKVLIVSDAQSVHTQRWVSSLSEAGVEIVLFTIKPVVGDYYSSRKIKTCFFDLFTYKTSGNILNSVSRHAEAVKHLRLLIRQEKPDILHAHYLTSYALIAALVDFHPLVVSMWGSDIYEFPKQSLINRLAVKYILRKADKILSTSHIMADEAKRYTRKGISITPFGVDTERFKPDFKDKDYPHYVIGTVKTLAPNYGIDKLIDSFRILVDMEPKIDCRLEIVGEGIQKQELINHVEEIGLSDKVTFFGKVDNAKLPEYYNRFSLSVFLSKNESFGVSAVESMACGCPVVASAAPGYREIIDYGETGIYLQDTAPETVAKELYSLLTDEQLRESMGKKARDRVLECYNWRYNLNTMIRIYQMLVD